MRQKHPLWTERQLRHVWFWQPTARRILGEKIAEFRKLFPDYRITLSPEAMGVNVVETLRNVGIALEFPVRDTAFQIALAGVPIDDTYMDLLK
jgi:hypothetical protein